MKMNNKQWDKLNVKYDKLHNRSSKWANARLHYKNKKILKV